MELPMNRALVGKHDSIIAEMAEVPKEWLKIWEGKGSGSGTFSKRFPHDFEFATRSDDTGLRSLYGRYVGKAGAFDLNVHYTNRINYFGKRAA